MKRGGRPAYVVAVVILFAVRHDRVCVGGEDATSYSKKLFQGDFDITTTIQ